MGKAISLTQPWAMLAVLGEKQFETRGRTWRKSHPREVYIHASGGFPKAVRDFCRAHDLPDTLKELCKVEPFRSALARHGWEEGDHLPTGVILGKVRVVRSCRVEAVRDSLSPQERAFGNYSDGRTAIELADPEQFKEWYRCGGSLGLWKVPADVEARMGGEQLTDEAVDAWLTNSPVKAKCAGVRCPECGHRSHGAAYCNSLG